MTRLASVRFAEPGLRDPVDGHNMSTADDTRYTIDLDETTGILRLSRGGKARCVHVSRVIDWAEPLPVAKVVPLKGKLISPPPLPE